MATRTSPYPESLLPPDFDSAVQTALHRTIARSMAEARSKALANLKRDLLRCLEQAPTGGDDTLASAVRARFAEILASQD